MAKVLVYHSPNFGQYIGDHSQIHVPPTPVASIEIPGEARANGRIGELEYAYHLSQHAANGCGRPWWESRGVRLMVRSTSAGDIFRDHKGQMFVVERAGFEPLRDHEERRCRCCSQEVPAEVEFEDAYK